MQSVAIAMPLFQQGSRREILDPTIAEHRGRVVKRTGDGILIAFASAVDAVRCAVAVQPAGGLNDKKS